MFIIALGLMFLGVGTFVDYWMRDIDRAYNEERRFFEETL